MYSRAPHIPRISWRESTWIVFIHFQFAFRQQSNVCILIQIIHAAHTSTALSVYISVYRLSPNYMDDLFIKTEFERMSII